MERDAEIPPAPDAPYALENEERTSCGGKFSVPTSSDAGGSYWAPGYLMAATRTMSCALLLYVVISQILAQPEYGGLIFAWTAIAQAFAFLLLALCSLCFNFGRDAPVLASLTVPMYQMGCTLSIFNLPLGIWAFRTQWNEMHALRLLPPLALWVVDALLGARVTFRFVYACIAYGMLAINIAVLAGNVIGGDPIPVSSRDLGMLALTIVALAAWVLVATGIAIAIMRLPRFVHGKVTRRADTVDEKLDSRLTMMSIV